MRVRLTKIAHIISQLDTIASEIERHDPKIALHLDKLTDTFERSAFYTPMGWEPGHPGPSMPGRSIWEEGERLPAPGDPDVHEYKCPKCGRRSLQNPAMKANCPHCGEILKS